MHSFFVLSKDTDFRKLVVKKYNIFCIFLLLKVVFLCGNCDAVKLNLVFRICNKTIYSGFGKGGLQIELLLGDIVLN